MCIQEAGKKNKNAMNPLPSLLNASAWDAANRQMRGAGRTKWSRADYNLAARELSRLVCAAYGRKEDADPNLAKIRFQIAAGWQRQGAFDLYSDMRIVYREIEKVLNGTAEAA